MSYADQSEAVEREYARLTAERDRAREVLESTRALSEQRRQEIERLRLRVAELEAAVEVFRPSGWDANGSPT